MGLEVPGQNGKTERPGLGWDHRGKGGLERGVPSLCYSLFYSAKNTRLFAVLYSTPIGNADPGGLPISNRL